jgi:hypothetical protein
MTHRWRHAPFPIPEAENKPLIQQPDKMAVPRLLLLKLGSHTYVRSRDAHHLKKDAVSARPNPLYVFFIIRVHSRPKVFCLPLSKGRKMKNLRARCRIAALFFSFGESGCHASFVAR